MRELSSLSRLSGTLASKWSIPSLAFACDQRIPISIVVTKIDIAPPNVYEENMNFLCKLMKSTAVKKDCCHEEDHAKRGCNRLR
eukprot:3308406-Amphidinium_carterae.1